MRRSICAVLIIIACGMCFTAPLHAHHVKQAGTVSLPVTTSSAEARALYEKGMQDYENLYLERCNDDWRAAVKADPKAVRQILLNLLSNAVKFTPEGGEVGITVTLGDRGDAVIRVADTGIGIPADSIERVFHPFERVQRDVNRKIEGTGLGLSITRGLVQLHGGEISLQSRVGEGTIVTVVLPAERVVATAQARRDGDGGRPTRMATG